MKLFLISGTFQAKIYSLCKILHCQVCSQGGKKKQPKPVFCGQFPKQLTLALLLIVQS